MTKTYRQIKEEANYYFDRIIFWEQQMDECRPFSYNWNTCKEMVELNKEKLNEVFEGKNPAYKTMFNLEKTRTRTA